MQKSIQFLNFDGLWLPKPYKQSLKAPNYGVLFLIVVFKFFYWWLMVVILVSIMVVYGGHFREWCGYTKYELSLNIA